MKARTTLVLGLAVAFIVTLTLSAQTKVTKDNINGITNLNRIETTIACAGAVTLEAVPEIKKLGFVSIINLREASEQGANVEAEGAAAKAAGLRYEHIPFNTANPAPDVADRFLKAITTPGNEPAFVHCAGGGRAAAMWTIKRMQVDGWDQARAFEEGTALGLTERLKPFVLNYVATHKK
jgi:uncharacterized protein (TIGR01244 family)